MRANAGDEVTIRLLDESQRKCKSAGEGVSGVINRVQLDFFDQNAYTFDIRVTCGRIQYDILDVKPEQIISLIPKKSE